MGVAVDPEPIERAGAGGVAEAVEHVIGEAEVAYEPLGVVGRCAAVHELLGGLEAAGGFSDIAQANIAP